MARGRGTRQRRRQPDLKYRESRNHETGGPSSTPVEWDILRSPALDNLAVQERAF